MTSGNIIEMKSNEDGTLFQPVQDGPGFYIAGKFEARARLRTERDRLVESLKPLICTASWLDTPDDVPPAVELMEDDAYLSREAMRDLTDVANRSVLFFLDTLDESRTGGRETELGVALCQSPMCTPILVGPKRQVFHSLIVQRYPDWEAVHAHIAKRNAEMEAARSLIISP